MPIKNIYPFRANVLLKGIRKSAELAKSDSYHYHPYYKEPIGKNLSTLYGAGDEARVHRHAG